MGSTRAPTRSFAPGARRLGRRGAGGEPQGAIYVGRKVAVAQLNHVAAQAPSGAHEGPGLLGAGPPVSSLTRRRGLERGVDIGRDAAAPGLEVVGGVDDDGEPVAERASKPSDSLAPQRRPERNVRWSLAGHRNMSSAWPRNGLLQALGRPVEPRTRGAGGPPPLARWRHARWMQPHRRMRHQ